MVFARIPGLGPLAILLTGMSLPYTVGTGTETALHLTVFLIPVLVFIWALKILREKRIGLRPSPLYLPLFMFMLATTVSFAGGTLPWSYFAGRASLQAQAGGWAIFILSAATFLLTANRLPDLRWLKILTALLFVYGAIAALTRIWPEFSVVTAVTMHLKALGAMLWVWVTALAGGQALFNRRLPKRQQIALGGFGLMPFVASFFFARSWASGWLPALATILILLLLRKARAAVFLVLAGAFIVLLLFPGLPAQVVASDQYSIDTRGLAWQILMTQVFRISPLIGLGPSNYYYYTPLFEISGYFVEFNSHNNFIDILLQTGVLGFVSFVWFLAMVARWGWSLRERVEPGFSRGYTYGCLGGLVGTLVACMLADWFIPFVYNAGVAGLRSSLIAWLFLGGLVLVGQTALVKAPE